ncbi:hypothetical protein [Geminicoccus roseus]|nr:hypothetical protein [Geminicoccus roseus]
MQELGWIIELVLERIDEQLGSLTIEFAIECLATGAILRPE